MDERLRRLARAARAGDLEAGIALARALERQVEIPKSSGYDYYDSGTKSRVPVPAHGVSLSANGPDLCIVPISEDTVFVMIGPSERPRNGLIEAHGVTADRNRFNVPFVPCSPLRGPVYTSPGGKTYEMAASGTFHPSQKEGYWKEGYWEGGRSFYYHFPHTQRRPRGYQQILRDTRLHFMRPLSRAVNAWIRDHPEEIRRPTGVDITRLASSLDELRRAEERVFEVQKKVVESAVNAAAALGF